jgi:hypothetical protein
MEIARIVEDANGNFVIAGFPTVADALAITWSQISTNMCNGYIDETTYQAIKAPASVGGYYLLVDAYNFVGTLGPDIWRANDGSGASGYFSFVATDYIAQDTGQVNNIKIELYDGNPTILPDITSGSFVTVNGFDDYDSAPGDVGRSWPTPLDAVAHGVLPPGNIITTYHKINGTQDLQDIVDLNGNTFGPNPWIAPCESWLYAVYYPDTSIAGRYNRDPVSEFVGYDDYKLEEGALVIFAIGNYDDWKRYQSFFPNVIYRQ